MLTLSCSLSCLLPLNKLCRKPLCNSIDAILPWQWYICAFLWNICQSLCISSDQIEVQSLLFAEAVGGASKNALKSIIKRFNRLWKEVNQNSLWFLKQICESVSNASFLFQNPGLVDQYMSCLLSLDQNSVSLPLLGLCVDFCTSQKDINTINKHKVTTSAHALAPADLNTSDVFPVMVSSYLWFCCRRLCWISTWRPFSWAGPDRTSTYWWELFCFSALLQALQSFEMVKCAFVVSGEERLDSASRVALGV